MPHDALHGHRRRGRLALHPCKVRRVSIGGQRSGRGRGPSLQPTLSHGPPGQSSRRQKPSCGRRCGRGATGARACLRRGSSGSGRRRAQWPSQSAQRRSPAAPAGHRGQRSRVSSVLTRPQRRHSRKDNERHATSVTNPTNPHRGQDFKPRVDRLPHHHAVLHLCGGCYGRQVGHVHTRPGLQTALVVPLAPSPPPTSSHTSPGRSFAAVARIVDMNSCISDPFPCSLPV